ASGNVLWHTLTNLRLLLAFDDDLLVLFSGIWFLARHDWHISRQKSRNWERWLRTAKAMFILKEAEGFGVSKDRAARRWGT
ncbi:MAG TPA: hypothetical protein VKJ45_24525, partial [Blastocatellia bacterium]|nr:hypothetical protein [Blastocatellia bacterium]